MDVQFEYKSKKFNEETLAAVIWKRFRKKVGSIYAFEWMYINTTHGGFRWAISPGGENIMLYINPVGYYTESYYESGPYMFDTAEEMCDFIEGNGYKNHKNLIGMELRVPEYHKPPESFLEHIFPKHWKIGDTRIMNVESTKCICVCTHSISSYGDDLCGSTWKIISIMEK